MVSAADVIETVSELFTWIGLGGAVFLSILTGILRLADGTWLPVRAVVEPVEGGRSAHWIDADGLIGEARLTHAQEVSLGGADMADAYSRRGSQNSLRLDPSSPAVRATGRLAIGFGLLGLVAVATQLVMLFIVV